MVASSPELSGFSTLLQLTQLPSEVGMKWQHDRKQHKVDKGRKTMLKFFHRYFELGGTKYIHATHHLKSLTLGHLATQQADVYPIYSCTCTSEIWTESHFHSALFLVETLQHVSLLATHLIHQVFCLLTNNITELQLLTHWGQCSTTTFQPLWSKNMLLMEIVPFQCTISNSVTLRAAWNNHSPLLLATEQLQWTNWGLRALPKGISTGVVDGRQGSVSHFPWHTQLLWRFIEIDCSLWIVVLVVVCKNAKYKVNIGTFPSASLRSAWKFMILVVFIWLWCIMHICDIVIIHEYSSTLKACRINANLLHKTSYCTNNLMVHWSSCT